MRIPTPKPRTEAMKPVTAASTSTDVITCARVAPSARNSASSRVRCATRMLNVLMMRKLPTNKRDEPEHQERRADERADRRLGALLGSCRRLLSGLRFRVTRERRGDTLAEPDVGDAALRTHENAVVLVVALEHLLRRRLREERDGRAGEVVRAAISGDAADGEVLFDATEEDDRQRIADGVAVLRGGAGVDHDVVGSFRRCPAPQVVRGDVAVGDPVGAEGRRTVAADRLAVMTDERCAFTKDVPDRVLDPWNGADGREQ